MTKDMKYSRAQQRSAFELTVWQFGSFLTSYKSCFHVTQWYRPLLVLMPPYFLIVEEGSVLAVGHRLFQEHLLGE
jgi:hypothetical protein